MTSVIVFIQLAGAVALLLFGLGQVREGLTSAFGVRLRMALGRSTSTRPRAFLAGLAATLGLQSSTATALMTAGFVEAEMIGARRAQMVLLGANVGTALTAVIVISGINALAPALLLGGYILARRRHGAPAGIGRALIGVGLILVALALLGQATAPLREAPAMLSFLRLLDQAWPVALLAAAAVAALCASSLAAVLLVATLALPPGLAVVLVLGANLGGALTPVLATQRLAPAARRVAVGNLVVRGIGVLAALPLAGVIGPELARLPLAPISLAVAAHLAFNLALAALIWPAIGPLSRGVARLLPDRPEARGQASRWLDEASLETPALALAGASREALEIGDAAERMIRQTRLAFRKNDPAPLAEVAELEDQIDRRQQEVKTFLSRLGRDASEDERRRAIGILDWVINLEHVGDIVDKGLGPEVRKKIGLNLHFSDEGYKELDELFLMTMENLRMAQTVFMTRDEDLARRLIEVKVEIRHHERQSAQRHLIRLREGHRDSQDTSSLHLDILRDLKRINAHIASVAHPILDEEGLLVESRLRNG